MTSASPSASASSTAKLPRPSSLASGRPLLLSNSLPAPAAAGVLDLLERGLPSEAGHDAVVVVVGQRGHRGDRPQQVARLEAPPEQRMGEKDVVPHQRKRPAGDLVVQ